MENERTKLKAKNNNKSTIGNVRKQTCEFTSDLNLLSHLTHQMKSATRKLNMKDSGSLKHFRMKEKIMQEGTKYVTQDDLQEDIENLTLQTHQAMHKEMLSDMKREDMQN